MTDDLISRADAIDYCYALINAEHLGDEMNYAQERVNQTEVILHHLEFMPSAQPEIVRCKDCKYKYIENDVWACPFGLPGGPEFFCGYGLQMAWRRTDERSDIETSGD